MKMSQDFGGEYNYSPWCSFHPKELVVGICAVCLRERLLDLASLKQAHHHHHHHHHNIIPKESRRRRKSSISLPRSVFALGSFLRLRLDTRRRPDVSSDRASIASLEDSFISFKFEDNGELTSWESKKKEKEKDSAVTNTRQQGKVLLMQQHPKPRPTSLIRWRKRMDQLLQLVARWKRSATTSSGGGHVAMAAKVEVGRGKRRTRSLTVRRRTRES